MKFDDLDDVLWNFVTPVQEKLREAMDHRKWLEDKTLATSLVESASQENPRTLAYQLTVDPGVPGCIILLWKWAGRQILAEPIRIRPTGFRYRHIEYERLESLLDFWKQNAHRSLPDTTLKPIERRLTEGEERAKREKDERNERRAREYGTRGDHSYAGYGAGYDGHGGYGDGK
jgi:hypothetical protein